MPTAHSFRDAANADNPLEGYAAMNADEHAEISRLAYQLYEERGHQDGFHEQDWYNAEQEIRRRKTAQRQGPGREVSQSNASRDAA